MAYDIKRIIRRLYSRKPKCDVECFHYGMFGGEGGCEALDSWGSIHEPLEPGETCLYPKKKDFGIDLGIVSIQGMCAALEGAVITKGKHDNTKFVKVLSES